LATIAFANLDDFARFKSDGSVEIFDYDKAREVSAKISVVTHPIGRSKYAKEVRIRKLGCQKKKFSAARPIRQTSWDVPAATKA
jgi:hypothetical protein